MFAELVFVTQPYFTERAKEKSGVGKNAFAPRACSTHKEYLETMREAPRDLYQVVEKTDIIPASHNQRLLPQPKTTHKPSKCLYTHKGQKKREQGK